MVRVSGAPQPLSLLGSTPSFRPGEASSQMAFANRLIFTETLRSKFTLFRPLPSALIVQGALTSRANYNRYTSLPAAHSEAALCLHFLFLFNEG